MCLCTEKSALHSSQMYHHIDILKFWNNFLVFVVGWLVHWLFFGLLFCFCFFFNIRDITLKMKKHTCRNQGKCIHRIKIIEAVLHHFCDWLRRRFKCRKLLIYLNYFRLWLAGSKHRALKTRANYNVDKQGSRTTPANNTVWSTCSQKHLDENEPAWLEGHSKETAWCCLTKYQGQDMSWEI